jgi:hypothetical protein
MLIIGTVIYCTCRQNVIFLAIFRGSTLLEAIKIDVQYTGNPFIYFLLFCLPDALWYFALLLLQNNFYDGSAISKIIFCFAIILPFILEILQYFDVIYGTFDFIDLIIYLITFLIFLLWKNVKFSFCK